MSRTRPLVGNIDYMETFNEAKWGNPTWIKEFKAAMVAAGYDAKIVLHGHFDASILYRHEHGQGLRARIGGQRDGRA